MVNKKNKRVKKVCTSCKNRTTRLINLIRKKDGAKPSRTRFINCTNCKKLLCGYCVFSMTNKVKNGKIVERKEFPYICYKCYSGKE